MQIYGPSQLHGAQPINAPHIARTSQTASTSGSSNVSDQLDISEAGQVAARMSEIPEIRMERVQAIREAILNGTYETDDKLNSAVDRLLDEIA